MFEPVVTWEKAGRFAWERCLELADSDDEVNDRHLPPYELTARHVLALLAFRQLRPTRTHC